MTGVEPSFNAKVRAWVTRRTALAGLVVFAAAGLSAAGVSYAGHTQHALVARRLRDLLPDIQVDDEALRAFAKDFVAHDEYTGRLEMAALRTGSPFFYSPAARWMLPGALRSRLRSYDRRIITAFFLSTNFFAARTRGDTSVTYDGYFNPYTKPCGNPLPVVLSQNE